MGGIFEQYATAEIGKISQMKLDDVEQDGQLQGLVFVNGDISKTDHSLHGIGQRLIYPTRLRQ
jgi:hypothetical protein